MGFMNAARWIYGIGVTVLAAQLAACSPLYLLQATSGQMEIMAARRPVAEVIAATDTSVELRRKLTLATEALDFAHRTLLLPDHGAYRHYADVGRPYAVWNVFAAPEFSLELRRWCFPVAGCVGYRGYFDESDARAFASRRKNAGDDVYVAGVAAYSTLGYLADPLLNTFISFADDELVGLIFHELAHQLVYVPDDTAFNESFASFLEQEGLRRWHAARGDAAGVERLQRALARRHAVRQLLDASRTRLAAIYGSSMPAEEKRAAKTAELAWLADGYREMRSTWREPPYFDAWFAGPLNNATLGALAAYDELIPAFEILLRQEAGLLLAFQARVRDLAILPGPERAEALVALGAGPRNSTHLQ
jgi:predicted aminopeptidase